MRPLSLFIHSQCRHTLFQSQPESWLTLASLSFRRHRTGGQSNKNKAFLKYRTRPVNDQEKAERAWIREGKLIDKFNRSRDKKLALKAKALTRPSDVEERTPTPSLPQIDPNDIPAFFESTVSRWIKMRQLPQRLESFGLPSTEIKPLLDAFSYAVRNGELSTPEGHRKYVLHRFAHYLKDGDPFNATDIVFTSILFTWASEPQQTMRLLACGISEPTIARIQNLFSSCDTLYPQDSFTNARSRHRKFIMHVGPTNSGKTHNALRALAASQSGVYAGPLRLLAHEIWERLNLGQIIPAGVEEDAHHPTTVVETKQSSTIPSDPETDSVEDADTALDVPSVRKFINAKYARLCNMRTGEEQRIVDDNAPLLACTVEMLMLSKYYDVAVIDEIQMISDPDRGSAWTHAVLGVNAGEVHLCGEETAVPIIEKLLEYTGDELVVKRYQRLSPLEVQEQSLEGDLTKVKKGDCIVTFSRSNIFKYKREIEARTDLRCAIVYGRLPPEIRSEQAALFNDPDSGYDVLIGSDAIGMGLNLKIRRVIFETTKKYDGRVEMPLSISQTKQIAGRAGRYGLHGDDSPAGFVTSLHQRDIDLIKRALDASPVQLSNARLGISSDRFFGLASALPANASTLTLLQAHYYITRTPEILRQTELKPREHHDLCEFIDQRMPSMSRLDRSLLLLAPIAGRDPVSLELVQKFLAAYQDEMYVDLWKILEGSPLIENLETVEMLMEGNGKSKQMTPMVLSLLESLHKAIVLYVWMTFRRPLSWSCIEEVDALKNRIERALDWGLQALTKLQQGTKPSERPLDKERVPFKRHYGDNTWRKSAMPSSPSPSPTTTTPTAATL